LKLPARQLTEHVYHQILARLVQRRLGIGEHVKSQDVASEFGISQATARTAIAKLVHEGWLESGENGRPVVVKYPSRRKRREPIDETFQSLTEATAERILGMALNRRFSPGEVIKARPLAEELGVSLATTRAALDSLCRDGVFNRLYRRGWQMSPLELEEVRTMFSIRRMLEAIVLERLFQRIDDLTLDNAALDGLLAETQEMIVRFDETSRVERMRAEHRFHQQLIALAGDQVLAEVLHPLLSKMLLVNVAHGLSRSSFPEHQRILEAIKQRNKAEAMAALERDLADPLEAAFYDWD
jgi:DNA-binding GntR family transcriptional regulator